MTIVSLPQRLHLLHTNDFHNALNADGAACLRRAIAGLNGEPYLFLDAGDAIKAGNVGVNPWGEPILERMSEIGYHAMTMGNREFHVWKSALETKIKCARFPILSANVRAKNGDGPDGLPVKPFEMFHIGGARVAVFGVTVPMVTERMKASLAVSSFVFDDPVKTAREMVARLRWEADVVIALTHIGIREDERLAREVSGIDLIVGGHSHVTLPTPQIVNGTPIVQVGFFARSYGHVIFEFGEDGSPRVASGTVHPLQEKARG